MTERLEALFETGPVMLAVKEAGAGALLADAVSRAARGSRIVALLQSPADRSFEGLPVEAVAVHGSGEAWDVDIEGLIADAGPVRIVVGASAGATIEKALIDAGRTRGIPVIAVVDHYWNLWQRFAGATPAVHWRYRPDTIYVPDAWCATRLAELGCPVGDVRVFRHAVLESEAVARSSELRRAGRERLGWGTSDVAVLFVSEYGFDDADGWDWDQPGDFDIEGLATELSAIVAKLAAEGIPIRLLIRPHPAERRDWNKLLGDAPTLTVDRELDKATALVAVDVAFGLNSMLLAEAARSGLPAFARFPSGTYRGLKLSDFRHDIRELRTRDESEAVIRQLIDGSAPHAEGTNRGASLHG